jgi:hypothetical protein
MLITLLGSIGVGMVWGWLLAGVSGSGRKPILNVLLLSVATTLLLAEVLWLAGWRSAVFLLGAAGMAFLIHRCWRRVLYNRFGFTKPV